MNATLTSNRPTTLLLACACLMVTALAGCNDSKTAGKTPAEMKPVVKRTPTPATPTVATTKATNPMDAERAMSYLTQMCAFGPRYSGSAGMLRQRAMIAKLFESLGATVREQEFKMPHPITRQQIDCVNLIVEWQPEAKERVLLCAHYDTRPLPDRDPNPRRRREGVFVGANDGASGVAVLMELGNHLADTKLEVGVDMVMFDAEEMLFEDDYGRRRGEYFWGSSYFANQYKQKPPAYKYRWGVLLDMVGDAELELLQEKYSLQYCRPLVMEIWQTAARLGVDEFVPRTKRRRTDGFIRDDHIPLNQIAKIPSCDIIDADYPDVPFGAPGAYWHTEQDIPQNCSGESLAKVSWVLLEWLKSQPAESK
ncbi:M28 family peptidase [Aeoliella mucimassa]|nr:M28 family peptidase [Aeoliella mucimassa]